MTLVEQLKRDEGYSAHIYKCTAGCNTIGIGLNLDAGMSLPLAIHVLEFKIKELRDDLNRSLPFYKDLDDVRQDTLINMAFNLGIKGLMKFKNFLAYVEQHNFTKASEEMLNSKWAKQVGNRAERLSKQMREGMYV